MKPLLVALAVVLAAWGFSARWVLTYDPIDSCVLVYSGNGHGSGAIVDVNCVLTARHVADIEDLMIRTSDGDEHRVVRVVEDPDSDMALLYIEGTFDEVPLLFDRTPLRVGDEIIVIGAPFDKNLQGCFMTGRVVKVDWECPNYGYDIEAVNIDVLDTHAGPGCSGGPVLDSRGVIRGVFIMGSGTLGGAVPVEELTVE